ncbi:Mis12-Mtw1 protein family-domain-containing protein [Aspergillus karnatakaensis]|uniref:Mis12-Mtw1 family protein n=1 Tax=Aspergillus karnatakaensis TaxID=1810916 RepID=UPI003CCD72E3
MTVTVLATSKTQTQRREPLRVLDMATSQARARHASSAAPGGGKGSGRRTRSSMDNKERTEEAVNGEKEKDKKRKADVYDEDIEGFQFSRITNEKQRAPKEDGPVVPAPEEPAPQPSPRRGRPPKKRVEKTDAAPEPEKTSETKGKRSTRGRPKTVAQPEPQPQPQPERSTRSTRKRDEGEQPPVEKKRRKGRPSKSHEEQRNGFVSPEPPQAGTSTIALPLADTPVIQRNREMRGKKSSKGNRRSSLSMRGRRASSLIDSGASNALPHKKVETSEFYKHIASDGLPEPRRMRQLLIWCATRAMGDKPSGSRSEDESARLAARVIQEELLKDFGGNSELSNWFAREETSPPTVVVKKPNPKNVQNQEKIKELEEQIQRLQRERHALNALLRPPSIPRLKPTPKQLPNGQSEDHPSEPEQKPEPDNDQIDLSILDPAQQQILASINPAAAKSYQGTLSQTQPQPEQSSESEPKPTTTLPPITPSEISTRLSRITSRLTPTLDTLAAGVHDIELYRSMSDAVSSRVLRICAERLEERDARNALRRLALSQSPEGEAGSESGSEQRKDVDVPLRPRPREDLGPILGALSRVERR